MKTTISIYLKIKSSNIAIKNEQKQKNRSIVMSKATTAILVRNHLFATFKRDHKSRMDIKLFVDIVLVLLLKEWTRYLFKKKSIKIQLVIIGLKKLRMWIEFQIDKFKIK